MNFGSPFERPEFVPEFTDFSVFRGDGVGLTGSQGVLGSLLSQRLARHGVHCVAYKGDVNDERALAAWFAEQSLSYFFHFAAVVPITQVDANPLLAFQTNAVGSFNVVKQLTLTQKQCWFFHCSSSHVYRPTSPANLIAEDAIKEPHSFYGETKLAAERLVETLMSRLESPYCIGRVFSFTHARQAATYLVPGLRQRIESVRDGETLVLHNPSAIRDMQDAEHVIDVVLHLAGRAALGPINIGSGIGRSVRDIALGIARSVGKVIQVAGADQNVPSALIADTTRLRKVLSAL